MDYDAQDALGLAERVRAKAVSPTELLDEALKRLDAANPKINATAHRFEHLARAQIAGGLADGPFHGVPFMTKDLGVAIAGAPMTCGSRAWLGNVAKVDSTVATRLKGAGLAIFGSTTSPELGLTTTTENRLTGATRNPWKLDRTAGGSSGGAAAVVAAGVLPMAQASDGGGSIRIPAACCGLVGLKPSRGRVPMGPRLTEGWFGMSTTGCVSRTVRDSAAMLDVIAGIEPGARYDAPAAPAGGYLAHLKTKAPKLRIALWTKRPDGDGVDPEVDAAVRAAAKLCEGVGHAIEETAPPFVVEAQAAVLAVIAASAARDVEELEEQRGRKVEDDELEVVTAIYRKMALTRTARDLVIAERAMQRQAMATAAFMADYDVILQPTLAKPPIGLGLLSLDDPSRFGREVGAFSPFTALYNQTGQPSISLPLGWSKEGTPIGVMFSGRYGAEDVLLRLAAQLEEAAPWRDKRALL